MVDRQFCSDKHRRQARYVYSARASRDLSDDFEESWIVRDTAPVKKQASFGPGTGIALAVLATLLVLFLPADPQNVQAPKSYLPSTGLLSDKLKLPTPGAGALSLREDFRMDMRNWQGTLDSVRDGWTKVGQSVRIGDMKLWKPTLSLSDYNLEFQTQIENKAVGWAFRATDTENYYATKISITQPGSRTSLPRAEIIRYVVEDGKKIARAALPIPLSAVDDNSTYEVKVGVRGSKFTTMLNGQMVDTWADNRFKKGGVGFFSDPGEKAKLNWVSISERENVLQRFLSFAFMIHPAAWPVAAAE